MLASASADKTIKLWDVENKTEIKTFRGHSDKVTSVAINHNDTMLASASADKTIKLWNIKD